MLQSFDKGKQLDIAILDFLKAFDTEPYEILFHKIHQYGIRCNCNTQVAHIILNRTPNESIKDLLR